MVAGRLRGWWHTRAIADLDAVARGEPDRIGAGQVESEWLEIADALRDENLPIDVLDMAEPTEQRLLEVGALGRYDRELKQAWERFFLGADPQALTIPLGACAKSRDGHL